MEIGSFIELQFVKGQEYYKEEKYQDLQIARLNTGRCAIYHAFMISGCDTIWLPYYQCKTVVDFLTQKRVKCKFYHINDYFEPTNINVQDNEAVLLVNYYGIISTNRIKQLAMRFKNVIIDNSQAFFAEPIERCINIYSARKFIGVPDGAYVIGKKALTGIEKYEQCYSSDTALFMLLRLEYGCEGKAYKSRTENENRINNEDCKKMSRLTHAILDGTDYDFIKEKRKENFHIAQKLFGDINKLNPILYFDETCVPMVYPLLIEDDKLLDKLLKSKHFQGHWWDWVKENPDVNSFEKWLSRYMIPITIDQRYGEKELEYLNSIISRN